MGHLNTPHVSEKRDFTEIKEQNKIAFISANYLSQIKTFYVKGHPKAVKGNISNASNNKVAVQFNQFIPDLKQDEIILYSFNNRYLEMQLKKNSLNGLSGEYNILSAKIANNFRKHNRIDVSKEDFMVENFCMGQYPIFKEMNNIPEIITQKFESLKSKIESEFQECECSVFDKTKLTNELSLVYKTLKPLYIEDTLKAHDLVYPDGFINCKNDLKDQFQGFIQILNVKKIRSLLIVPVTYINFRGESVLIGFFRQISKTSPLSIKNYNSLKGYADTIVKTIQKSNFKKIDALQKIVNISKNGIQMKVTNPRLIDLVKANPHEMIFDIKPNPHKKFTLLGKVTRIIETEDKGQLISVNILGGNKRLGLSDWERFIATNYNL